MDCLVRAAGNRVLSAGRMNLVLPYMAAGAFYTASRRKEGPKLTEAAGVGMLLNTAGEMLQQQGTRNNNKTWNLVNAQGCGPPKFYCIEMVGHTRSRQRRQLQVCPRNMEDRYGTIVLTYLQYVGGRAV